MNSPLSGLIAAPFTPFADDGSVAFKVIPAQASHLAKNGVSGAFVCGTTGEGYSMTSEERIKVANAWSNSKPSQLKLIIHAGHSSLGEAKILAKHAEEIKADAISTLAPNFFKPTSVVELVAWCSEIAAAAPKTPFYYYHIPSMTGVTISATDFLREADGKIPTLAGVKFTYEDLEDFKSASEFKDGDYTILFGRDEILLNGLQLNAPGAIGSTYNYAAPLYTRIQDAYKSGDIDTAKIEQAKAQQFIDIMIKAGGLAAGKKIMKLIGIDCGPTRLPLRTLTQTDEIKLRAELDAIGFFDYSSKP